MEPPIARLDNNNVKFLVFTGQEEGVKTMSTSFSGRQVLDDEPLVVIRLPIPRPKASRRPWSKEEDMKLIKATTARLKVDCKCGELDKAFVCMMKGRIDVYVTIYLYS